MISARPMPKLSSHVRSVLVPLLVVIALTAISIVSPEQGHDRFAPSLMQLEQVPDEETLSISQSYELHYVDGARPYPDYCSVHWDRLRIDKVGIAYGYIFASPINKDEFPYSNKWVYGGCIPTSYRYAIVMYCPKCREIEADSTLRQVRQP